MPNGDPARSARLRRREIREPGWNSSGGSLPEEREMLANPLKDRVRRGDPVFGTILPIPSPEVAEIAGLSGYDFLLLDMEHGPVTLESLEGLVRACRAVDVVAVARVP